MSAELKQITEQYMNQLSISPYQVFPQDMEKFAELIIKKCVHLVETRDPRVEPSPGIYLLKAFGVEE